MARISFNGQEYDSVEAMPPEVRQLFQMAAGLLGDANNNGVPDILEGAASGVTSTVSSATQIVADGKVYSSVDELPPEARQRFQEAMGRLGAGADLLGGAAPAPATPAVPAGAQPPELVKVVGEGRRLSAAWVLALAAIVVLASAVVLLLLR
jgi:hypothetical protein